MGTYNIHAGHCPQGHGAYGAVGLLKESVENRVVKNSVIEDLRSAGHTVYDCTDDSNCDEITNLARIVSKCNAHGVDLDVSIHLNSGRNDYGGDGSTGGVEVFCYDKRTEDVAQRICDNISKALGIRNRGVKYSSGLYVLNNTASQAILIECCFVDDKDDVNMWNAVKCGDAIASGILGRAVSGWNSKPASKPINRKNVHLYEFNGGMNQQWKIEKDKDGYMKITCVGNGLCLDADGAGKKNGTNVQVYPSNNTSAQRWKEKIIEKGDEEKGTCCVELIPKYAPDMRVDCKDGKLGNKTNVQLYKANGTDAHRWYKRLVGGKYIVYVNVNSGRVLDGGGKI